MPVCRDMDCVERGGAMLKCDLNQFCCGENEDIACADAEFGDCFNAPEPYCKTCSQSGQSGGGEQ